MPVNRKKMRLAYKRWKLCREWVTTTLAFMPEPKRDTTSLISTYGLGLASVALGICKGELDLGDPEVQERLTKGLAEQWVITLWTSRSNGTTRILRAVWQDIQPELVKHYDAWED